jgi:hypothetical protein
MALKCLCHFLRRVVDPCCLTGKESCAVACGRKGRERRGEEREERRGKGRSALPAAKIELINSRMKLI